MPWHPHFLPLSRSLYTFESPIRALNCLLTITALFSPILTSFNPFPESTSFLFRHPYQKTSLRPQALVFAFPSARTSQVPAFLSPLILAGLFQGPQACSPPCPTIRPPIVPSHVSAPLPTRSSPGAPRAPRSPRCPRPRSFTRRLQDVSRSPRTWRPALLNHPPTIPQPPSRHFRPQRPYAQSLPVVRQRSSG